VDDDNGTFLCNIFYKSTLPSYSSAVKQTKHNNIPTKHVWRSSP
jgi:hypothetical protein